MSLTLQTCESYLFDSHVFEQRSSLEDLFLNSEALQPLQQFKQLQFYSLNEGRLTHKGEIKHGFKHIIKLKGLDLEKCFVIELACDPFSKKQGVFQYLIDLSASFHMWDRAIIVKKDLIDGTFSITQTSDHSDFLTLTYFRRFAAMFPQFLKNEGVVGVFPVIAQKTISE